MNIKPEHLKLFIMLRKSIENGLLTCNAYNSYSTIVLCRDNYYFGIFTFFVIRISAYQASHFIWIDKKEDRTSRQYVWAKKNHVEKIKECMDYYQPGEKSYRKKFNLIDKK